MSYIPYLCKFNSFTWTDRVLCQLTSPVIPFSAEMLQSLYVIHSTNKLPTSYSRMCVLSQSVSRLRLFVTPCTATCQAPLSTGILQARILEWVAMASFRWLSQPRDQTQVFSIAGRFFTFWASKEAQEYWSGVPLLQWAITNMFVMNNRKSK